MVIYYLGHPYSDNPEKSFRKAQKWTYILRKKGLPVFSPILHTHPYYDTMSDNFGMFGEPIGTVEECTDYLNTEDFVDWDIKIMEGFMNWDGVRLGKGESFYYPNSKETWDSGIIMLLSDTAFVDDLTDSIDFYYKLYKDNQININKNQWKEIWESQGCRKEYEFAKSRNIRVLELESFLEGKEVEL